MFGTFLSGISGLYSSLFRQRVSANNVANMNTLGYKAAVAQTSVSEGGAASYSVMLDSAQGAWVPTNRPLDLAVQGDGFFKLIDSRGSVVWTRSGSFVVDSEGYLATSDGFRLSPPVRVDSGIASVTVAPNGAVSGINEKTGELEELGSLQLFQFPNPAGLKSVGAGKYGMTEKSGAPTWGAPGSGGLGTLQSGGLEASNVDLVREMADQTLAQRSAEANLKVIQTANETIGTVLDIVE